MAPTPNPRLLFNKIPAGYPVPGESTVIDARAQIDLDAPLHGGVLLKVLVLSVDPYLRGRMRDARIRSYAPAFQLGEPIENFGVAVVVRSENAALQCGDHVYGVFEFQAYIVRQDVAALRVLPNTEGLPWSVYLGAAGMPGQTAYVGWKKYAKAKKGETLFVNTAAGPVGSVLIQIAKAAGLKVVASAGSDAKVAFARSVGADVAFNYKTTDTRTALSELGDGIDIFWDHVGGEMVEIALDAANNYARVIVCGAISVYNAQEAYGVAQEAYGVKNLHNVLTKRITVQGFIVGDSLEEYADAFYADIPGRLGRGEMQHREQEYRGLEGAEQAMVDVQTGANTAKGVAVLADA